MGAGMARVPVLLMNGRVLPPTWSPALSNALLSVGNSKPQVRRSDLPGDVTAAVMIERHRLGIGREHDWGGVITANASHAEYQLKTAREPKNDERPGRAAVPRPRRCDTSERGGAGRVLGHPAPCSQWKVGGLVSHVVAGKWRATQPAIDRLAACLGRILITQTRTDRSPT